MSSPEEIGAGFITHFYQQLDAGNQAGLHGLHSAESTLSFNGTSVTGADGIVAKYVVSALFGHALDFGIVDALFLLLSSLLPNKPSNLSSSIVLYFVFVRFFSFCDIFSVCIVIIGKRVCPT